MVSHIRTQNENKVTDIYIYGECSCAFVFGAQIIYLFLSFTYGTRKEEEKRRKWWANGLLLLPLKINYSFICDGVLRLLENALFAYTIKSFSSSSVDLRAFYVKLFILSRDFSTSKLLLWNECR